MPDSQPDSQLADPVLDNAALLIRRFEQLAAEQPAASALEAGAESYTYAELNARANQFAHALLARGIGQGASVVLALPASVDCIAMLLAVCKTGAAYAPVGYDWPAARVRAVLARLDAALLVCESATAMHAALDHAVAIDDLRSSPDAMAKDPAVEVAPDDVCYVMHTSGTTGEPKGVLVTHGNLAGMYSASGIDWGLPGEAKWLWLHALAFGYSAWEIWGALAQGGCLVIVPEEARRDPLRWSELAAASHSTMLSLTPSALRQLAASGNQAGLAPHCVFLSGEALRHDDLPRLQQLFDFSTTSIFNLFALTETAGRVAVKQLTGNETPADSLIGQPAPDAELFVVEPASLAEAATGELLIAGPMLSPGYADDAVLTADRFVMHDPGDGVVRRCYRTGDRVRRTASGEFEFAGRIDAQIKLHGYRIEPADIEQTLRGHPGVADAAVTVRTEASGAEQLAAVVVRQAAAKPLEFWPSLGEHLLYDELLYDFMAADEVRIESYRAAFAGQVADQVVLDIGTGRHAVLARMCAAAGARKVYAVEVLEDAAREARELIAELGLSEQIEVICGDIQQIELPEKVSICTQGIVGNIGSSDGIVPLWNAARRWFSADLRAIPEQCETLFAPGELPQGNVENFAYPALAREYLDRLFKERGAEFDPRLCVRNFPKAQLLADASRFELLDFTAELNLADHAGHEFVLQRPGRFDGFLLWTRLLNTGVAPVDFLEHQQAWLPVWLPVAGQGVALEAGDRIIARSQRATRAGSVFPDYLVEAEVWRDDVKLASLTFSSPHQPAELGATSLHRALHANSAAGKDSQLTQYLAAHLPPHMQPVHWTFVDRLPLNQNGKLDRRKLSALVAELGLPPTATQLLGDAFANNIGNIWAAVLGRAVGPDADFFASGGDSILAVRLTTEIQNYLDDTVFLAALFDAPTLGEYVDYLRREHADAVARRHAEAAPAGGAIVGKSVIGEGHSLSSCLSHAQQSLWFLQQLYPASTAANEQFLIRIGFDPDVAQLRMAWEMLVNRHAILRMVFRDVGGEPRQHAGDMLPLLDDVVDLRMLACAAAEARLLDIAAREMRRHFDLASGPLLRPMLVLLPEQRALILATAHHIIADGLTVPILARQLAALYRGGAAAFSSPEWQFSDHVQAERNLLSADFIAREAAWWREQLAGANGTPVLPAPLRPSERPQASRGVLHVAADSADQLRRLGAAAKASPFMVLLTIWRAWLAHCLDNQDLLIGTPMTLRKDAATGELPGCMVNNIALRNPLQQGDSFRTALVNERNQVLAEWEHSELPFDLVVEAVQPERVVGRHPLFQAMYFYSEPPPPVAGFSTDVLPVARDSFWDLDLTVTDHGSGAGLQLVFAVRDDLVAPAASAQWAADLEAFIAAVLRHPDAPLAELPLTAKAATPPLPAMPKVPAGIYTGVAATAERLPDAPAVRDAETALTYRQLLEQAERFAAGLQARGVSQGSVVGVAAERSAHTVALLLAINRVGATWLALDPVWPRDRIALMLDDTQPGLLVTDSAGSAFAAATASVTLHELGKATGPVSDVVPAADAFILFTSGSTGRPKGAALPAAGILNRCLWMWQAFGFAGDERFAHRTSLNFVDSAWEIFGPLLHGAELRVLPAELAADPSGMCEWLKREAITHLVTVPALLDALLHDAAAGLTDLRSVISSGETLMPDVLERFQQTLPGRMLLNTYGATECWDATCARVDQLDVRKLARVPIGRAIAQMRCEVVNASGQLLPAGMPGELSVSGINVARGYVANPQLSAAKFATLANGWRSYRTGDLAIMHADGAIELLGRADRQFKMNGIRVEPNDIEANVRACPGIGRAAVLINQVAGSTTPVLFAEPVDAESFGISELRAFLTERLPAALIPGDMRLLPNWPVTPSGKTDLRSLAERLHQQIAAHAYVAPGTPTEIQVAEVWSAVLGVARIGKHDDFFALGGHSLLATRVLARLTELTGVELPLQSLFEKRTLASVAESVDALRSLKNADGYDAGDGAREVIRL